MKIEFENSIRRLRLLCDHADIKITWINPWQIYTDIHPGATLISLRASNPILQLFFFPFKPIMSNANYFSKQMIFKPY